MFSITKYGAESSSKWDDFVGASINAVFLHFRAYMDYHAQRFRDNSLMIFKNGKLWALLPANLADDGSLHSHQGLTYGGLLFLHTIKYTELLHTWDAITEFFGKTGIKLFYFKPIPEIYVAHPFYTQEECALSHFNFFHKKTEANLVIDLSAPGNIQHRRIRAAKKAVLSGIEYSENTDLLKDFWMNVLSPNLEARHQTRPVHSFEEITLLRSRFPDCIKTFFAVAESKVTAGVVLYLNRKTAHAQYIAASPEGRSVGATDFLFVRLIQNLRAEGYRHISLGVCADRAAGGINLPLTEWKEGWGAKAWPQKLWTWGKP